MAPDVEFRGSGGPRAEPDPLRAAHGQLELDRPGEQDLVERVVLEDRDDSSRSNDAPHPAERLDRVAEAVQALGAPGEIEGAVGEGQAREVGPRETSRVRLAV